MATVKTIYEVKTITIKNGKRDETTETLSVSGSGQKAANAVDAKFKGKLFKKFFKGFQIGKDFLPFTPPKIYNN